MSDAYDPDAILADPNAHPTHKMLDTPEHGQDVNPCIEWVVRDRGDCEPDRGWCRAHESRLPSDRVPAYCDDLTEMIDMLERYEMDRRRNP